MGPIEIIDGRVQATPLLQNRFLGIWSLLAACYRSCNFAVIAE